MLFPCFLLEVADHVFIILTVSLDHILLTVVGCLLQVAGIFQRISGFLSKQQYTGVFHSIPGTIHLHADDLPQDRYQIRFRFLCPFCI